MAGVLEGITVLDLAQNWAGPGVSMYLADHGAEVIKVEPPGGDAARGWGVSPVLQGTSKSFLAINRNKRSIAIDLKAPDGLQLFYDLVRTADVLVINVRPAVAHRLGVGALEHLEHENPSRTQDLREKRRDRLEQRLLARPVRGPHAGELGGGVAEHDVRPGAELGEEPRGERGVREVALERDHVRLPGRRLERGEVDADHATARPDDAARQLEPAAGPAAEIHHAIAGAQAAVRRLDLLELVGGSRGEPLALGPAVEGVLALVARDQDRAAMARRTFTSVFG